MRRAHTVTFKSEYRGHIIVGQSHDGGALSFHCELLKETRKHLHSDEAYETLKSYDNVASILDAIDRYDLSLRKDFTNTVAYRIGGGWREEKNKVYEVTVTSVTEDGREAWIKGEKSDYGSGRTKVSLTSLYSNKEACQRYVETMNALKKKFEQDQKAADAELNKAKNLWTPKTEA